MMTNEEWQSLVGSPGWPKFKQYLRDCREGVKEGMARDRYSGMELEAAIIECQLLLKHSELTFDEVSRFYKTEETDES